MVPARYAWVPPRARSLGGDCVAFWRAAGGTLFEWQELVIDGMLGVDEREQFASRDDGMDVARQNGKGVILQAIEVYFAFELGYRVVMHTAHEFATSQEHQLRLDEFIQDAPELHAKVKDRGGYMHANGRESINLKSGARIIFKARTKGGGRGWSGDLLLWDEAMVIPDAVVGAQKPTLRASQARYGPKTIYAGSAVDQDVHEYGAVFARLRARGIAQEPRMSWHEWSAPYEHPSQLTPELLRDRSLWLAANPSIADGLVSEEYMADEIESMPPRIAAVELLGVGDWPDLTAAGTVIDIDRWDNLFDPKSQVVVPVFAYDVAPDRSSASIAAVGLRSDGKHHLEIAAHGNGTAWVVPWLAQRVPKHKPLGVICDSLGQASSLIPELSHAGVEVRVLSGREYAAGCGLLFDSVAHGTVRHRGQVELRAALQSATKRKLSDAWAWNRAAGGADISPLVAVSVGLEGWWLLEAEKRKDPEPMVAFL